MLCLLTSQIGVIDYSFGSIGQSLKTITVMISASTELETIVLLTQQIGRSSLRNAFLKLIVKKSYTLSLDRLVTSLPCCMGLSCAVVLRWDTFWERRKRRWRRISNAQGVHTPQPSWVALNRSLTINFLFSEMEIMHTFHTFLQAMRNKTNWYFKNTPSSSVWWKGKTFIRKVWISVLYL